MLFFCFTGQVRGYSYRKQQTARGHKGLEIENEKPTGETDRNTQAKLGKLIKLTILFSDSMNNLEEFYRFLCRFSLQGYYIFDHVFVNHPLCTLL